MSASGPSEAARGYISEQVVYGVTVRFDRTGRIMSTPAVRTSHGDFSGLWIRWDQTGESPRAVQSVSGGDPCQIDVTGCKYKIIGLTFLRTPGDDEGDVADLRVKDDVNADGERAVVEIISAGDIDGNQIYIKTNANVLYQLDQGTHEWTRFP